MERNEYQLNNGRENDAPMDINEIMSWFDQFSLSQ